MGSLERIQKEEKHKQMKNKIKFKRYIKNDPYQKKEIRLYFNGDKYWRLNGKLHKEDGPAVEMKNGYKEWWLHGRNIK